MTDKPTCGTCRFFNPEPGGKPDTGTCRWGPPSVQLDVEPMKTFGPQGMQQGLKLIARCMWPTVAAVAWCGRHEGTLQ